MRLFHKDEDYQAFERVLAEALDRYPVDLLTYCLMPNHWHLVLRPRSNDGLGRMMGWLGVTHVRRHHEHHHTRGGGHLYQGRYKSFPVQDDRHFLTACRYVEANPLRAGLAAESGGRAESWPWCGLALRQGRPKRDAARAGEPELRCVAWPVDRPRNWVALVNERMDDDALDQVRRCVQKGMPYGDEAWVVRTAKRLGLQSTLRSPGRPRGSGGRKAGVGRVEA
jgi:putative transposase